MPHLLTQEIYFLFLVLNSENLQPQTLVNFFIFSIEFRDPPIYGCDVARSFTDPDLDVWNLSKLNTILNIVNNDLDTVIQGVNSPYLYFGMWRATFSWHVEDMDLYGINMVHYGKYISVNPMSTVGADYAHHITIPPSPPVCWNRVLRGHFLGIKIQDVTMKLKSELNFIRF